MNCLVLNKKLFFSDSNKINTQLLDESNVAKSHVEPEIVDSNITKKRGRKSKKVIF